MKSTKSKHVTIVLDDVLEKKLRIRQAKQIEETSASCSFSKVLNDALREGLD